MRGQLYRGHANATALFSSPVVSALGSELDDPVLVLAGTRRCALETCGKKKRAPLLGLAKSIYYKKLNYAGILIGSHVRSIGEHTHTQRQHQPHSAFFIT